MILSRSEIDEIKAEVAAFDEAAKWKLINKIADLNDEILERAVDALGFPAPDRSTGSDLKVIPVPKKIELNGFSKAVQEIIGRSMCYSRSVGRFIYQRCRTESSFAVSLRTYFCQLYVNLRHEGLLHDDLFLGMQRRISNVVGNELEAAAATAILVHLFLICDVFEKSGESTERRLKEEAEHDPS